MEHGTIIYSVNLKGWERYDLTKRISDQFDIPVYIENDANVAGLGESWLGAGKGKKVVLGITLGTGMGGSIIIDNKIYNGSHGYGAELGHITVNENGPKCTCSNRGCLEEYVSARGIIRTAAKNMEYYPDSALKSYKCDDITPHLINKAANQGDSLAREVLRITGRYLGIGLATFTNIFNPDVIVLGGGIMTENQIILYNARKELDNRAFKIMAKDVTISISRLGDDANLIGAIKNGLNNIQGRTSICT